MPARLIEIAELQPTDTLRPEAVAYFMSLSHEEIRERHGIPQVWETERGIIISDGNNRTGVYARKGIKRLEVDFQKGIKDIPDYFLDYLNGIISQAEVLKMQGIYTPYDLWNI